MRKGQVFLSPTVDIPELGSSIFAAHEDLPVVGTEGH
jgi:hypothetical protein